MTSLVWLRRDLRLHDHAALATALQQEGDVQCVFIFDTDILARFTNKHDRRLSFIAATLCDIDTKLRERGGQLLVLKGKPQQLIPKLATAINAKAIYSAEDFEPATRARDKEVKESLPANIRFVQVLDHLLRAPQRMVKADKTPYKVFTPYYKLWRQDLGPSELAAYEINDKGRYAKSAKFDSTLPVADGPEALLKAVGYQYHEDKLWKVTDARKRLKQFIEQRLKNYPTARDVLAEEGTSKLSPYLRHGLLSIRECATAALEQGGEKWISELAWREFYAAILFHFPDVVEHEFTHQYRGTIPWVKTGKLVDAFMNAQTGFPLVDAAVRELIETGYMHNRARMIVASFATKDLLMDWRVGEEFFAQYLMDYELASNNGGWQWAASTGTDASPYFRIFNPELQSKKFDPEGEYIKRYLPQLRHMSAKEIHVPHRSKNPPIDYPLPVVEHDKARQRAIDLFGKSGQK